MGANIDCRFRFGQIDLMDLTRRPPLRFVMQHVLNRLRRSTAVWLSMLLLLASGAFGSSRDFGAFLLSVPVLSALFLLAFVSTAWSAVKKWEPVHVLTACAAICLTPLAYFFSYGPVQHLRFLLWAPAHYSQLAIASKKNGIVTGWASWGMAGMDTFSYLVVDTEDRLGTRARADQWTKQIGQSCGLWETQRMWPKFYIVTTYTECPYDGVEPAS